MKEKPFLVLTCVFVHVYAYVHTYVHIHMHTSTCIMLRNFNEKMGGGIAE